MIGLIRNDVLERMIERLTEKVQSLYEKTGQKQRLFAEGFYQAQSWEKERRVIMKAEMAANGTKPSVCSYESFNRGTTTL